MNSHIGAFLFVNLFYATMVISWRILDFLYESGFPVLAIPALIIAAYVYGFAYFMLEKNK